MEKLLKRQHIIAEAIRKLSTNIKKDPASRKTSEYVKKRLLTLEQLWEEFMDNHNKLIIDGHESHDYFQADVYHSVEELYDATSALLMDISSDAKAKSTTDSQGDKQQFILTEEKGMLSRTDEMISQQITNFRAFSRSIIGIEIDNISEKWELEDKLNILQSRWKTINELHWKIDNLLSGTETDYEQEYSEHEAMYESMKKQLSQKLSHTSRRHKSLPKLEIPEFTGNYAKWPTFMDLYSEAIHNNHLLSKTQKMQYLKDKLKGEPERLVQHLNISADNYDTCWEIITHRYDNKQLLFSKQIQTFLNQPTVHKHTAYELKRLHDVTMETIHAIRNLGVDTTTWDPFLVHILTEKMYPETYTSYMEARKAPRALASFDEAMTFLEDKFTALEPTNRQRKTYNTLKPEVKENNQAAKTIPKHAQTSFYKRFGQPRTYHASAERKCPLCALDHILIYCKTFQNMSPETKIKTLASSNICENCLYSHGDKQCNSMKTCKVCNCKHHTTLHDALHKKERHVVTANTTPNNKPTTSQHKTNHVATKVKEVLLATAEINILTIHGMPIKLRALVDQGSQINLITESAAQRLGLQRRKQDAIVSGVGISNNKCNGIVQLNCESMYGDYRFTVDALVMPKLLNFLPNRTFEKQNWSHLQNINLVNLSRSVDILLDAGVYAEIVMGGILRGPLDSPIAQQTKIEWILMGTTKTFQCHTVLNNLEDIAQFWEAEDISEQNIIMSPDEQCFENLYASTTTRSRYQVRLPMKPKRKKKGNRSYNNYSCIFFLLMVNYITSTLQQAINITTVSQTKLLYFDKIADVQIRQDDWKMVIFYNMTTYWQSFHNIQEYVNHLKNLSITESTLSIATPLQHEINELQHYNDMLRLEHGIRTRRALINGIGYAANYLFGVLDVNFAQKYDKDIYIIQSNEIIY